MFRRLRWLVERWSADEDRRFHDTLYATPGYDPFTFAYPGYLTIRRFADLAAPYLERSGFVLDLGCGPGEITCELASRFPAVTVHGVDHSVEAVRRAQSNAARRALTNVSFARADLERFEPDGPADLVMMFDAFHHLTDPAGLIRRLENRCPRFLLVEPRGDWHGGWRKDLEFDWIVTELDKIRSRVAYLVGEPEAAEAARAHEPVLQGRAVERRYAIDDFEGFFAGYSLEVRGTVAGLEVYPPSPHAVGGLKERFGRLAYELLADIDARLRERNLDLLAKHWVVYAERGGAPKARRAPSPPRRDMEFAGAEVAGPYEIDYLEYRGPESGAPGERLLGDVRIRNRSWRTWSSTGAPPFFLSYHWFDASGRIVDYDGARNTLPRDVKAGDECTIAVHMTAPAKPGRYELAFDMVHEGVTWFSDMGHPCLRVAFRVLG